MISQLLVAEKARPSVSQKLSKTQKSELGQFMTPEPIARFMASMFSLPEAGAEGARILDAGAGIGSLLCAFLDRCEEARFAAKPVEVTAYEIDSFLYGYLCDHLQPYKELNRNLVNDDYIHAATRGGLQEKGYTHVILNPPYKKIGSQSAHRLALRSVGIETVNLYTAFLALALHESAPGAQIVAIIPRSFCNGSYYKSFRKMILDKSSIRDIHLFDSRSSSFKDDEVLQENIIIRLEKGADQGDVCISRSTDGLFHDLTSEQVSFDRVVHPGDRESFIRIPSKNTSHARKFEGVHYSLEDLGLHLSTGPVIDYRVKEHLCRMPIAASHPLIYPAHLSKEGATWPIPGFKKWNAIENNEITQKWLWPMGYYCVVKRFSAKEQKRRVIASVIDPRDFSTYESIAFENHLNVFHHDKGPIDRRLASGISIYLNSTLVDDAFREFNGSTQVNATDLKQLRYPSKETLMMLGERENAQDKITQKDIDNVVLEALSVADSTDTLQQ